MRITIPLPSRLKPHTNALLTALALSLLLVSCSGTAPQTPVTPQETPQLDIQTTTVESLLQSARSSASPLAEQLRLDAVDMMLDADALDEAEAVLSEIRNTENLPQALQVRYALSQAALALSRKEVAAALQALENPLVANVAALEPVLQIDVRELRAESYYRAGEHIAAVRERIQLAPLLNSDELTANNNAIWEILSSAPASSLSTPGNGADSYELRGWFELMRLVSTNQYHIQAQMSAIDQWRNTWTQHSASTQLPDALNLLYDIWENRPREIALVLPMQEPLGRAISEGFLSAYYDAIAQGHDVPAVRIYDTSFSSDVLVSYDEAVEDGVDMIIGPLLKDAVRRMQQSSRPMPVPTLALNYGDLGAVSPAGLYQFGLAPEDEIIQAADTAWAAGHRNAAVLTPTGGDYQRIQDTFVNYWTELGGRVVSMDSFVGSGDYSPVIERIFSIDASKTRAAQIRNLVPRESIQFTPRRRQDVDFIFLLANPAEGRQIKPTLTLHFAGDVPVYAMPSIYDGGSSAVTNRDLNGVIFNDAPWVLDDRDPLKRSASSTWPAASGPIQRLRAMGVDSYRLYLRLPQMERFPYTRIVGATGMLSMKPDGGIRRQLNNAVIVNGVASALPR